MVAAKVCLHPFTSEKCNNILLELARLTGRQQRDASHLNSTWHDVCSVELKIISLLRVPAARQQHSWKDSRCDVAATQHRCEVGILTKKGEKKLKNSPQFQITSLWGETLLNSQAVCQRSLMGGSHHHRFFFQCFSVFIILRKLRVADWWLMI